MKALIQSQVSQNKWVVENVDPIVVIPDGIISATVLRRKGDICTIIPSDCIIHIMEDGEEIEKYTWNKGLTPSVRAKG